MVEQWTFNPLVLGSSPNIPKKALLVEVVDTTDLKFVPVWGAGSSPVGSKVFLVEVVDTMDSKSIPFLGCWFESSRRYFWENGVMVSIMVFKTVDIGSNPIFPEGRIV